MRELEKIGVEYYVKSTHRPAILALLEGANATPQEDVPRPALSKCGTMVGVLGDLEQEVEDVVGDPGQGMEDEVGEPGQGVEDEPLYSCLSHLLPLFFRTVGTQTEVVGGVTRLAVELVLKHSAADGSVVGMNISDSLAGPYPVVSWRVWTAMEYPPALSSCWIHDAAALTSFQIASL